MKTPREILFEKHQPAQADLDRIRRKALAVALSGEASAPDAYVGREQSEAVPPCATLKPGATALLARAAFALWQNLICPCRRSWTGLAALWIVILAFNAGLNHGSR